MGGGTLTYEPDPIPDMGAPYLTCLFWCGSPARPTARRTVSYITLQAMGDGTYGLCPASILLQAYMPRCRSRISDNPGLVSRVDQNILKIIHDNRPGTRLRGGDYAWTKSLPLLSFPDSSRSGRAHLNLAGPRHLRLLLDRPAWINGTGSPSSLGPPASQFNGAGRRARAGETQRCRRGGVPPLGPSMRTRLSPALGSPIDRGRCLLSIPRRCDDVSSYEPRSVQAPAPPRQLLMPEASPSLESQVLGCCFRGCRTTNWQSAAWSWIVP